MKQFLFRVIAFLMLFTPFFSTDTFAKVKKTKVAQSGTQEKSLLWKITGNGLEKPSYLFGTIHIICKNDFFWTDAMESALQQTEKVTFELDLDDPALQMQMAMALIAKDGKSLKSYFTAEDYELFNAYAKENLKSVPFFAIEKMTPTGVMMLMSSSMFKCEETSSYEMSISEKATTAKKEILGLETLEEQLTALNSMPADSVIDYINSIVKKEETGKVDNQFAEMIRVYKDQDLEGMIKLTEMEDGLTLNTDAMLNNRNKNWIPVIEKMIHTQPTFIAVGAAHLGGKEGVIQLLKAKGYKLEAVR